MFRWLVLFQSVDKISFMSYILTAFRHIFGRVFVKCIENFPYPTHFLYACIKSEYLSSEVSGSIIESPVGCIFGPVLGDLAAVQAF